MSARFGEDTRKGRPRGGGLLWSVAALVLAALVSVWALADPDEETAVATAEAALAGLWDEARALWPDWPRDTDWEAQSLDIRDADPDRGRALIQATGCGACHTIPGIAGAEGSVGPNLTDFADRAYVAGVLPNRPGDLTRWLINPPAHAPETAMPDVGLNEEEARHVAAYLYGLGRAR